ncbi:MAG: DUF721 domain-containing protein [Kiritimatiellae bacterium]|nr:DUF721 domain-containing protein [Kiritimatiellia bacterium]
MKKPFFPPPDRDTDPPDEGDPPIADPETFYAHPSRKRKTLTPNDLKRNAGVDRLFDAITPGLPIDTDPAEIRTEAQRIAQPIEDLLKKLKITASPWIDDLAEAWPALLPEAVTRHTVPGKWDNGILYVYVSSSMHLFEIRRSYLKTIEEAVRRFAGDRFTVKQVRLMVNTVPPAPHTRPAPC